MARDTWFETVAIAQQRAKKRLPKSAYSSLISASEKGVSVADNVEAFSELGFAPHVIGAPQPASFESPVPESLHHSFVVAVTMTNLVFWLAMGVAVGTLRERFAAGLEAPRHSLA